VLGSYSSDLTREMECSAIHGPEYSALVSQWTADAAFAIPAGDEIQYWNKAAEHLFGYPAEEVRNKTCHQILKGNGVPDTRVCHEGCSVMECAANQTEIPNFDMSVQARSGQRLWVNISTLVFENSRNARRLLIHLAHDISEHED